MPYRNEEFAPGEYAHLYNRGNNKQLIFHDESDYIRLLFCILHFQSPINFINISRQVSYFMMHGKFNVDKDLYERIVNSRSVELISFTLMPNHIHLGTFEIEPGGTSKYIQRISNSYTKYMNTKYKEIHTGHLFQGVMKSKQIKNNAYLLHLSAYIHKNPKELKEWGNRLNEYPWSSYQDYVRENRWGELLKVEHILGQFDTKDAYINFVETNPAKEEDVDF